MTQPAERTAAVIRAGEFLYRLTSPYVKDGIKKIPKDVREEARMTLRHYPSIVDLMYPEKSFDVDQAIKILTDKMRENEEENG